MKSYERVLDSVRPQVSFGVTTIRILRPSELGSLQIGYSVSPTGESLTCDKDGDWLPTWVVIGYGDACGDPIFIDTSCEVPPVYTAMHDEGRWDAERIAVSLESFGYALSVVAKVAEGREHPAALENNPLSASEKETALAAIGHDNPGVDLEFWEMLLS